MFCVILKFFLGPLISLPTRFFSFITKSLRNTHHRKSVFPRMLPLLMCTSQPLSLKNKQTKYSLTEVYGNNFLYYKIQPFKACSSVTFSISTEISNHPHNLILEYFYQICSCIFTRIHLPFLSIPLSLGNH